MELEILIQTIASGCEVFLDGMWVGKTGPKGTLVLRNTAVGEHYVQIKCPQFNNLSQLIKVKALEAQSFKLQPTVINQENQTSVEFISRAAKAKREGRNHLRKAFLLKRENKWSEAINELRQASLLDPKNADIHRDLGITFLLMKEWKRAVVELREAIRLDPESAEAHNHHGYALEKINKLKAALDSYQTAVELDPSDQTYRQRYTNILVKIYVRDPTYKR